MAGERRGDRKKNIGYNQNSKYIYWIRKISDL